MKRALFAAIAAVFSAFAGAQGLTLHGASQFNDDHAFTKALVRFQELVDKYLGQEDDLGPAQELGAGPREAVLRVHGAG